jgi:hypothetical protein
VQSNIGSNKFHHCLYTVLASSSETYCELQILTTSRVQINNEKIKTENKVKTTRIYELNCVISLGKVITKIYVLPLSNKFKIF